jgi:hypothetical protein
MADELPEDDVTPYPLMLKRATPFEKFKPKGYLSVTDLVIKYCELMKLYEMWSGVPREISKAMRAGDVVHQELEATALQDLPSLLVAAHEQALPLVVTKEEEWAVKLFGMISKLIALRSGHSVREFYVFGKLNSHIVTGFIDELRLENKVLTIVDTKTRQKWGLPRQEQMLSAFHQVLIYHRLFALLAKRSTDVAKCLEELGLDVDISLREDLGSLLGTECDNAVNMIMNEPVRPFETEYNLRYFAESLQTVLSGIGYELSDKLWVEYLSSSEGTSGQLIAHVEYDYDEAVVDEVLDFSFDFWDGKRHPLGVDATDIFKCTKCPFNSRCQWRELAQNYALSTYNRS